MLNTLSETLGKYAHGWLVLLCLAGMLLFNGLILPNQQATIERMSGGVGTIDPQLFYTPEKAYSMVSAYGGAGRIAYRNFELTGDILYPVLYTAFFALLITWLYQRGFTPGSPMQKSNVVPLGGWLFDLFENLGIAAMLSVYPSTPAWLARAAAVFTLLKWLFAGAAILLILIGLVMVLKNKFRKQQRKLTGT